MKKVMISMVISTVTFFSLNIYAVLLEGWERPISESLMKAEVGLGIYADTERAKVTLTQRDQVNQPTGLHIILDNGREMHFQIFGVREMACGSKEFLARIQEIQGLNSDMGLADGTSFHGEGSREAEKPYKTELGGLQTTVALVDHTHNVCMDVIEYIWKLRLTEEATESVGELVLTGNSYPVYTIQGGLERSLYVEHQL